MKFSSSTHDLTQALQLVSRAISSQQALPILGNILLEAKGDTCTASATDLELSIITTFPAKIESEGSITIPAKAIVNFAQYNPDADVVLESIEGTQLRCTSSHAKTMISGEAASEYPTITRVEKTAAFTLPLSPFLHALHLVTFASARTSLRPVLSGVFFRCRDKKLTLVATDSYRLSECTLSSEGVEDGTSCIIPTKILEEVKVLLLGSKTDSQGEGKKKEKSEGTSLKEIEVTLSKQQIEFRVGNTQLFSRLIDGKFPDYEQIVPRTPQTKILFPLRELQTAVKRMHFFAKEMNNTLTFRCNKGESLVSTPQTQQGKDEAILSSELTGQENKIALSSSYLLDFLSHLSCETVEMQITDSLHPAIFRVPEDESFLHLVMPLRMQEE